MTVIATGAWLKNRACLLDRGAVQWSALHGDLGTPEACAALDASVADWLREAAPLAFAHDLHPDFYSSHVAQHLAAAHGVPAVAVQHHHAHIAAVVAEHGLDEPVIGLALDGVGLGTDGLPWGGELLWVHHAQWQRLGHLQPLPLVGGDRAAREPWRMAAAVLHESGRGHEITARLGRHTPLAEGVATLLGAGRAQRTTSAGRWFDAAASALGLVQVQSDEAEAAMALERAATDWLTARTCTVSDVADKALAHAAAAADVLDLRPLVANLFDTADPGAGAARFHATLATALTAWALRAATAHGVQRVCLGGGCFYNRLLTAEVERGLAAQGIAVHRPAASGCGDAGLALGQAWVAAHTIH